MALGNASALKTLPALANHLEIFLTSTEEKLKARIAGLDAETRRIRKLSFLSEDAMRKAELSESLASLDRAERHHAEICRTSGFSGLGKPIQRFKSWRMVGQARAAHASAEADFDAADVKRKRDARITEHNQKIRQEHDRIADLERDHTLLRKKYSAVGQLRAQTKDAIRAIRVNAWLAACFPQRFLKLVELVESDDLEKAFESAAMLKFQQRPADALYEQWRREAEDIRSKAYRQYAGMPASGAHTEIAEHSVQLSLPMLQEQAAGMLSAYDHPSDQWQLLSALLADPRRFRTDALWTIYWAMHQCGQWIADTAALSDPHEDVLTGEVTSKIDTLLGGWATDRVRQFGYPEVRSYLGTLRIASSDEESRLGADIGLLVDLHIGDLVCQKVVLFQAKKARQGRANIGSDSGQLSKLAKRTKVGFYLFYHQSTGPIMAPAPTVCAAHELASEVRRLGKDIDDSTLRVNVRAMGWDWASFIGLGLCRPDSPIGESFGTIDEAFTVLGNGDARHLPKYLHVIAISDEPRVLALRRKIQEHYLYSVKMNARGKGRVREPTVDRDDPEAEHGLSL